MLDATMRLLAHVLMPLFFLGLAGSAVVVAITFFHDVIEFFSEDDAT